MTYSKSSKALDVSALSSCDQQRLKEVKASAPVYHIGKQWAVTGYGIEELRSYAGHRPYYHIPKRDLSQMWPRHMAAKTWVDSADFNRAFTVAIDVHNVDLALSTQSSAAPAFEGAAIKVPDHVLVRWQKVYRNIHDWPAALHAVDDFCASYPSDDPTKLSRASLWLERRNSEAGAG